MGKIKKATNMTDMDSILAEINEKMGKGVIALASSDLDTSDIKSFSSGSYGLNAALGVGGYPMGRQIEISGAYSVGKTHLALGAMIETQKLDGIVAYIDLESSFDMRRASELGLNTEKTILSQPEWLEKGLDIMEKIIPVCNLIVFDSIGGSSTRSEYEGTAEENDMGVRAKRLTRMVPKLGTLARMHDCTIIWINQVRDNFKNYAVADYNNTPGGNNFKHQQSIRIFAKKGKSIEAKGEVIGHMIECKVVKNKVSTPFGEASIPFLYESGISNEWEMLILASEREVIEKKGIYYRYDNTLLGQGEYNAVIFLQDNPEIYEAIRRQIN